MNQSDRVWYYAPGPRGPVRRVAVAVSEPEESAECDRVNVCVYAACPADRMKHGTAMWLEVAVPIRLDYTPGSPVDTHFCTPVRSVEKPRLAPAKAKG